MATRREKMLIGGLGGIAIVTLIILYLIMPAIEGIQKAGKDIATKVTTVAAYDSQISQLDSELAVLRKLKKLPDNLEVKTFEEGELQRGVKTLLNQIVAMSSQQNNTLISLEPWKGAPSYQPKPELDEEGNPLPVDKIQIETFGYTLVVRGSYDGIQSFLSSLRHYNQLVEIKTLEIVNEGGEDRETEASESSLIDLAKPIKLTSQLVLFLQPKL